MSKKCPCLFCDEEAVVYLEYVAGSCGATEKYTVELCQIHLDEKRNNDNICIMREWEVEQYERHARSMGWMK